MRKIIFIIFSTLIVANASGQAVRGIAVGVTKSTIAAEKEVKRIQSQSLRTIPQSKPIKSNHPSPVSLSSSKLQLGPAPEIIIRHYSDSLNAVCFRFEKGLIVEQNTDGIGSYLLYQSENVPNKTEGEHAYKGQSTLGKGVYYFNENYSQLRVELDSINESLYLQLIDANL